MDECKALKQKVETSDQRMFELEERNFTLENELSKSYKNLEILQGIKYVHPQCSVVHHILQRNWNILQNNVKLISLN